MAVLLSLMSSATSEAVFWRYFSEIVWVASKISAWNNIIQKTYSQGRASGIPSRDPAAAASCYGRLAASRLQDLDKRTERRSLTNNTNFNLRLSRMPSSPARHTGTSSPARRSAQSPDAPRTPHKPSAPRRAQSYTPHSSPSPRAFHRPSPSRRHTTQTHPRSNRPLPPLPDEGSGPRPGHRRTASSPSAARGGGPPHVLIPVPIRARDAESPVFVRAPSGQRVDFLFSPPKKRGLIGRLLDSVEWGDPQADKPYRYRKSKSNSTKPVPKSPPSRPFYKKLLS
ncbi:hypothetical protein K439DRAFT_1620950 [Ramaria rubella]|nr:hypothetical protein K439DRAFT_1620950 [Ramaria rubella]